MIFGVVTVAATVVIFLGFVVDAVYVMLDPRLRLGAARR
jgi:ABC-type dipeptide/oligopeptide/nickel transport system permease component